VGKGLGTGVCAGGGALCADTPAEPNTISSDIVISVAAAPRRVNRTTPLL